MKLKNKIYALSVYGYAFCVWGSTNGFPIESDTLTPEQRQQIAVDRLLHSSVPPVPVVVSSRPSEASSASSRLEIDVSNIEAKAEGDSETVSVYVTEGAVASITAKGITAEASGGSSALGIGILDEKANTSVAANSITVSAAGNSMAGGVVIGGGLKFGKKRG